MEWTAEARQSLKRVPFFVRPIVKRRAEQKAREQGQNQVDAALMKALREKEHTG